MRLPSGARGFESLRLRISRKRNTLYAVVFPFFVFKNSSRVWGAVPDTVTGKSGSDSTFKVETFPIKFLVRQISPIYHRYVFSVQVISSRNEVIQMNYEKTIKDILDSFGVHRSYTGYNYVTHGLLLIMEDKDRLDCITKLLYPDIAFLFHTSWNCVEKNIRTVVNSIWESHNTELLKLIFNKSAKDKKPTNKNSLNICMTILSVSRMTVWCRIAESALNVRFQINIVKRWNYSAENFWMQWNEKSSRFSDKENRARTRLCFWLCAQYSHRTTTFCGVVWAGILKVEVV